MWAESWSLKVPMLGTQPLRVQDITVFTDKVLKVVINLKLGCQSSALTQCFSSFCQKTKESLRHTQEDQGEDRHLHTRERGLMVTEPNTLAAKTVGKHVSVAQAI